MPEKQKKYDWEFQDGPGRFVLRQRRCQHERSLLSARVGVLGRHAPCDALLGLGAVTLGRPDKRSANTRVLCSRPALAYFWFRCAVRVPGQPGARYAGLNHQPS